MVRLCVSACVHMKPVCVVGNVEGNGAGQPASTPALPSFRGVSDVDGYRYSQGQTG